MTRFAMHRVRFSNDDRRRMISPSFLNAIHDVKKGELELCHRRSLKQDQMHPVSRRGRIDASSDHQLGGDIHDNDQSSSFLSDDAFLNLNVGGKSYRIRIDLVLERKENSLMDALVSADHTQRLALVDAYLPETNEYYIERNVKLVDHIIDYYITGILHKPVDVCVERFKEELRFWNLHYGQMAPCCAILGDPLKDTYRNEESTKLDLDQLNQDCCGRIHWMLWNVVENPQSSLLAKIFAFLSISFVFVSVLGLVLGSMPEFQQDASSAAAYHLLHYGNRRTDHPRKLIEPNSEFRKLYPNFVYHPTDAPNSFLTSVEYLCIGWFTFEYLLRLLVAPRKLVFFVQPLNVIDLSTIFPFYLEVALPFFGIHAEKLREFTGAMLVVRILRVLRMARVFRLARYSTGLQTFGSTLRSSVTELTMLGIFLVTGIVFFSTIMYFLEKDETNSEFYSIPAACWWCVVTMTTIGYGDSIPQTTIGKIIATSASICGIIVLAFPISMIVEKFATAQQRAIEREAASKEAKLSSVARRFLYGRSSSRSKVLYHHDHYHNRQSTLLQSSLQELLKPDRKPLATIT